VINHYNDIIVLVEENGRVKHYFISHKTIAQALSSLTFKKKKKMARTWLEIKT